MDGYTEIVGNTFPVRAELRLLGCRWDGNGKKWWAPQAKAQQAQAMVRSANGRHQNAAVARQPAAGRQPVDNTATGGLKEALALLARLQQVLAGLLEQAESEARVREASPDYAQPRSGRTRGRTQALGPTALAGVLDVEGPDAGCAARTARCVRGLDHPHGASRKPLPPIPGDRREGRLGFSQGGRTPPLHPGGASATSRRRGDRVPGAAGQPAPRWAEAWATDGSRAESPRRVDRAPGALHRFRLFHGGPSRSGRPPGGRGGRHLRIVPMVLSLLMLTVPRL
jgi:hypothetical protein